VKHGLILVEGQTEEQFVREVLSPYLSARTGLWLTPTIVVTKVVKAGPNFKGGLSSYDQVRRDVLKLLQDSSAKVITTLFDYYGLPDDFPGMASRPLGTPRQRVNHVQDAFGANFADDVRFLPFLALHEFEAWLYCDLGPTLEWIYTGGDLAPLRAARQAVTSPEEINENYATAPSRRLKNVVPSYQKPLHGPMAALEIGIDAIRAQCPHFQAWLTRLEQF
jgi:hypothetical protein